MYINRDDEIVQPPSRDGGLTVNYLYLLIGISLLLFISVSDAYTLYTHSNKNKMGFSNLSAIYNKKSEMLRKSNPDTLRLAGVSDDFLFWFSGFTDAEGNFLSWKLRSFFFFFFFKI